MPRKTLPWPALQPTLFLAVAGANGGWAFAPFAGVEELRPQRLQDFCQQEKQQQGASNQLRHCSHSFRKTLDDGGDVEMAWHLHVDPDSVLSLDTEAEHGVRLAMCSPNELKLELPESHAKHAAQGKFVVGSRFAHVCKHLPKRHLYHRILDIKRHEWRNSSSAVAPDGPRVAHVHLSTEELPGLAHIAPSLSFSFAYTPAEARNVVAFPNMRTDLGKSQYQLHRERRLFGLEGFGEDARRGLQDGLDSLKSMAKRKVEEENTDFLHGRQSSHSFSGDAPMLNMAPKQISNFGWNWNFLMNTTGEPEFNITVPGAKGTLKVRDPYIKAHAGIYLNFSSEFSEFGQTPLVRWTAGINGHGRMQARILSTINTTDTEREGEGTEFDLPILEEFQKAKWFDKIDIAVGSVPISFEPGMRVQAKIYHKGTYNGAIAMGGRTHGIIHPSMTFDSRTGLSTRFEGTLLDTDIWPPMWMIFTKRFEMGLTATPTMLMRGDFAGLEKASLAMELRPYLNITVRRDSDEELEQKRTVKLLTVYPIRAMGLNSSDFHRQFKIAIEANGQVVKTSPRVNWGDVTFRDRVPQFNVGSISLYDLLNQPIKVTLVEVGNASTDVPSETTLGVGSVRCESLHKDGCHPLPAVAHIQSPGGDEVAAVEVAIIWDDSPEAWLASKVMGAQFSFPEVLLTEDDTRGEFSTEYPDEPVSLRVLKGGLSYWANVYRSRDGNSFLGVEALDFGPTFVGSWKACPQSTSPVSHLDEKPGNTWSETLSKALPQPLRSLASRRTGPRVNASMPACETPKIELYYGAAHVASGNIPEIDWESDPAIQSASVPLQALGAETVTVATLQLDVKPTAPAASSLFFQPSESDRAAVGSPQEIVWTIHGANATRNYTFELLALKLGAEVAPGARGLNRFGEVNSRDLVPVPNESWTVEGPCKKVSIVGMSADVAPCTFRHSFELRNQSFAVGDIVVVRVQWAEGGPIHILVSPPVEVVSAAEAGSERRLQDAETHHPLLWSEQDKRDWDRKVAENQESCDKRDLHFKLGAGMLARTKVEDLELSNQGPSFPGLLSTPFERIVAIDRGTEGSEILPDELCADGLCQGALPGCTQDGFRKKTFPQLVFDFNRPFQYNASNKATFEVALQEVLAYAFAALPEVVDIAIKEINSSFKDKLFGSTSSTSTTAPVAVTLAPQSSRLLGLPAKTTAPPSSPQTAFPSWGAVNARDLAPAPAEAKVPSWWDSVFGGRRLRDSSDVSAGAHSRAELRAHQVAVRFRDGLQYPIDRPLIEKMIRHGYFMDVQDGASRSEGPLQITGFHLEEEGLDDDGISGAMRATVATAFAPLPLQAKWRSQHVAGASVPPTATRRALILIASTLAAAACLVLLVLRTARIPLAQVARRCHRSDDEEGGGSPDAME